MNNKNMDHFPLILIVLIAVSFSVSSISCHNENELSNSGCKCIDNSCGCCQYINWTHINGTVCANLTYLPHDYGLSFTVTYNNQVFYNETISARNPPPVCFGIPELEHMGADICLQLCDLTIAEKYLHGCVNVKISVYHIIHKTLRIGCFDLPISKSFIYTLPAVDQSLLIKKKSTKYNLFKQTFPTVILI